MASDQAELASSLADDSERATRIELASSVWKTEALPLSYARLTWGNNELRPRSGATPATECRR